MEDIGNGDVYVQKGERFPRKCPKCKATIPFIEGVEWIICKCGHEGLTEEFEDVVYELRPVN
jgi:hypothetical protein